MNREGVYTLFGRKTIHREPPDADAYHFALMYAVSLRQRRREDGQRAYDWREIRDLSRYPGTVAECVVAVTYHLDALERVHIRRMESQLREMTYEST